MIQMCAAHADAIRQHAETDYPNECCGVLLGALSGENPLAEEVRTVTSLYPVSNSWGEGSDRRYLISPDTMFDLLRREREGEFVILGFYHSHPDHPARPSVTDRDWAVPWYVYLIVSVLGGRSSRLTAWQLDEDGESFVSETVELL
jgi:proteasome lid subunit RPN8/RPN11